MNQPCRSPDRSRIAAIAGSVAFAALVSLPAQAWGDGGELAIAVVVGHNLAPPETVSTTIVLGMFARKRLLWSDRSPVLPVNLAASHPLRRAFSLWVFKKPPEQLQDYWNDQYFHGVLPPPVLASEEAVLRFVAATRGAVGYVSVCSIDRRVDVIAIIQGPDGSTPCAH
jgi:hypothetical protein